MFSFEKVCQTSFFFWVCLFFFFKVIFGLQAIKAQLQGNNSRDSVVNNELVK